MDNNTPPQDLPRPAPAPSTEHLNIKVTDNNNEVFFKIKRTTQLKKLMDAFCERQGRQISTVRFLFDGTRVRPEDSPDTVSLHHPSFLVRAWLPNDDWHRLSTRNLCSQMNTMLTKSMFSLTCKTGTPWRCIKSRLAVDKRSCPLTIMKFV